MDTEYLVSKPMETAPLSRIFHYSSKMCSAEDWVTEALEAKQTITMLLHLFAHVPVDIVYNLYGLCTLHLY